MESFNKYERYQRQVLLKEIGMEGQEKLLRAKVLVIGAGGLGCPALQYLTAAGVGTIGIVDFDIVDITNLHRQVLYTTDDIGKPKAITAAEKLKPLNPDINIISIQHLLKNENALEIISEFDIVIDGSDNFTTRYLVNDACVLMDKPLVYGAILRFEGQLGVFNLTDKLTNIKTNYRDLFPLPPSPGTVPSCSEAGVLGILPGIIGTMQAAEAIKIITGIGQPLCNRILSYNVLSNSFYEFRLAPAIKKEGSYPNNEAEFIHFNYEWFCAVDDKPGEITAAEFDRLKNRADIIIIDVREKDELPQVNEFPVLRIPFSQFNSQIAVPYLEKNIVLFCQSGKRSFAALKLIKEKYPDCRVHSLKGGIGEWKKEHLNVYVK